jgi:hypothetical protein
MKYLILALLAAAFSLSVSGATNLNSSRSNATKEQVAECNAKKDPKEKKACQQKYGIAVSDEGTPSDKNPPKK